MSFVSITHARFDLCDRRIREQSIDELRDSRSISVDKAVGVPLCLLRNNGGGGGLFRLLGKDTRSTEKDSC